MRSGGRAAYVIVLPQHKRAIEFWLRSGYSIVNTVELAKVLEPAPRELQRAGEGLPRGAEGVFRWGGTREAFLEAVSKALRDWLRERYGRAAQL